MGISNRLLSVLLCFLLLAVPASAQIFNSYPFILQNGTTADATQVMADFNQIANQVNANAAHRGNNSDLSTITALANGSAGIPSLTFQNFGTTGLFYDTINGCLGVTGGGVEAGCWNASGIHLLPVQSAPAPQDAATVGYVNSVAGGASIQARLTLTNNTPVMSSSTPTQSTIYLCPYKGNVIAYISNNVLSTSVLTSCLSQALNDITLSPAAAVAGNVYDMYYWFTTNTTFTGVTTNTSPIITTVGGISGGTGALIVGSSITGPGIPVATTITSIDSPTQIHISNNATASGSATFAVNKSNNKTFVISRGPAWSSLTARGTAAAIAKSGGFWVNNVAITNGPAAGAGIYLGTIATDSGGPTVSWIYGGAGVGGVPATFGVWNWAQRVQVASQVIDSGSWSYNSPTFRPAHGSTANVVTLVTGLSEDNIFASESAAVQSDTNLCLAQIELSYGNPVSLKGPGAWTVAGGGTTISVVVTANNTFIPILGVSSVIPQESASCGTASYLTENLTFNYMM